ncbi:hypothetical protein EV361DRAFT_967504, partial [Lentinula raphanica]
MANIVNMDGEAVVTSIGPDNSRLASTPLLPSSHQALVNPDEGLLVPVGSHDQSTSRASHANSKKQRQKKSRSTPSPGNNDMPGSDDVERKRGRESSLSQQQQDLVRSHFTKWERLLEKKKLHLGKFDADGSRARDPSDISTWVDSTVETIRTSPEFGTVNDTAEKVTRTIKDMFRNYRNNTFIKKNQHEAVQRAIAELRNMPTKSTMEAIKAANALVSFQKPAPAKDLFRIQNHEAIQQEADKLRAEAAQERQENGLEPEDFDWRRDDNKGGFYQRALSELWSKADQDFYKDMVKRDVFANQEIFPAAVKTSLQAICENGAVGPMELVLLAGFRNEKNRVVTCQLNAHHISPEDGTPPPPFLQRDEEKLQFSALQQWWLDYCETYIPTHKVVPETPTLSPHITFSNGVPVLTGVDLARLSASDLGTLMKEFLSKLWDYSWPKDQERASIPLAEIKAHPDDFYDTKEFDFAVPFTEIETLGVLEIIRLATYFIEICAPSCSKPFTFRTKEEIAKRTALRAQEEELEQSTGEEIVMTDVLPPVIPNANASKSNVPNANVPNTNGPDWGFHANVQTLIPNSNNSHSNQGLPMAWEDCSNLQSALFPNVNVPWEVRSDLRSVPNGDISSNPMAWASCSDLTPNNNLYNANVHSVNGNSSTWNSRSEITRIGSNDTVPSSINGNSLTWNSHSEVTQIGSNDTVPSANNPSQSASMAWWEARSDVPPEAANSHHAPSQALQRSHSSQLLQHSQA